MATVRFSDQLKSAVRTAATEQFTDRITEALVPPGHWGDMVYAGVFGHSTAAMAAVPVGYLSVVARVSIFGLEGGAWSKQLNTTLHLPLSQPRPVPDKIEDRALHGIYAIPSYTTWTLHAGDARWDTFKAEYLPYCQAIQDIAAERDAFVAGVEKITKSYTTLAPALKVWPALWDLLPKETQARHKLVVERTHAVPEIGGVDLDTLTATVVANKITRKG